LPLRLACSVGGIIWPASLFDKPFWAAVSCLSLASPSPRPGEGGPAIPDEFSLSYFSYRLLGALVPWIPPRLGYALFDRLGDLAHDRATSSRRNVYHNLRHVLGSETDPAHLEGVARQIFRHQARNYYDLFRVAALSAEQIREFVTPRGMENIDKALQAGKGIVMFTAHYGSLDIASQRLALEGYPITVVAEHLKPERLFRYVTSLRATHGLRFIPNDSFLRPLYRALRNNEILALASDRNLTGSGRLVSFFGAPALLPDGHVRLALRCGAKLLPTFGRRRPDNSFEIITEPALELQPSGDAERDVGTAMDALVSVVERYVGQHPEQWVLFQPVWALPSQTEAA